MNNMYTGYNQHAMNHHSAAINQAMSPAPKVETPPIQTGPSDGGYYKSYTPHSTAGL